MCHVFSSCSSSGSSALLLRGAVFFISMALWGSKRVPSLKYPPNAVLPAFLQVRNILPVLFCVAYIKGIIIVIRYSNIILILYLLRDKYNF